MLDAYLETARRRLRWRFGARLAAAVAVATLAVTGLGAWLVMMVVPSAGALTVARVLLYAALGGVVVAAALRRWDRERVGAGLERRVPEFGGRLGTWIDARRRGEDSALLRLLDRQTADIATAHPPARVLPAREIVLPALAAVAAAAALGLLLAGSRPWQLAAQRLWAGELLAATQPRIAVSPGDAVVRRGSDVVIQARAHGFATGSMEISADFGGGWERAPMSDLGDQGYGFVFVGVGEPVAYYVSARGVTSTRHRIEVADLPQVTRVETVYRFPAWTGLEDRRLADGDVTALPGTRVAVTAFTDRPVDAAVLVVNGAAEPMQPVPGGAAATDEPSAQGAFAVSAPGSWHVAVRHEGALARISDTYLIEVAEDAPPELSFTWPGHDRTATAIEEVALEFEARDDYGVEALTLHYAVNGGDWAHVALTDGAHLLALEALTTGAPDRARSLVPGDVISLYAQARDHSQTTRSALYFVDVRPFDMRYRESQQMGGQGGAEGGGFDMAERQRDILTATWNLINKRDDAGRAMEARALADEAEVLAMLQRTLAEQVQTLIARSAARGLGRDDEVSTFIAELGRALEHMTPAAEQLGEQALEAAVPSEQRALQHLVTAETSVRDVNVSLSRNQGRGTSGRSLSELVELEMDPERNRYEMPQQPGSGQDDPPAADEWRRLDELAARQEQLARRAAQNPDSLPSRWEQARLRRELESLRRELEAGRERSQGRAGGSTAAGDGVERTLAEVDRARQALERNPSDPDAQRQAAEALRRAADSARASSRGDLEARLARAGRQVANLQADQQRVMEALEALQEQSLERARRGESLSRGDYGMQTFAAVKRRMQEDLAQLRGRLTEISDAAGERGSEGARVLDRALRELDEGRVDERLAASADAFDMGQPLYVIGSETLVEQALARLARRVAQAEQSLTDEAAAGGTDPLAEVRELRRRLLQARSGDGAVERATVEAVVRDLGRLGGGADAGGRRVGAAGDLGRDDGVYRIRGTADENTEALYRLTLERLDLAESALLTQDAPPIRAEEPRQAARDSAPAARYFRELSRSRGEEP